MLGLRGGNLEDATLLDSEILINRPPSIYTPDKSLEAYAPKSLFLANPDASTPPPDSTVGTRASSPTSYFIQPSSQPTSRYPPSISNPINPHINRMPVFPRSSITNRVSSSRPPLPPPSNPLPPLPFPATQSNYPYAYQPSPITSWGSHPDGYTFILHAKTLDASAGPSNTNASTPAASTLLDASTFPEPPFPSSPHNLDHRTSNSNSAHEQELDEDATSLESYLPQIPPLTHKSPRSTPRFEELKLGGRGVGGMMWVDSNGMAGGTESSSTSRRGTASSSRTDGSGLNAEYEALEAYTEGRSWAK